jgi:hypothetical protein
VASLINETLSLTRGTLKSMMACVAESTRVLLSEGLAGEVAIVFCISFVFVTSVLMLASKSALLAIDESTGNSEHEEHEDDGELQTTEARFHGPQHHIALSGARLGRCHEPTPSTPQPEGLRRRSSRNSFTSEDEAFLISRSSCGSLDSLTFLRHSLSCDSFGLVRNVSDTSLCSITEDSDFHPAGRQASTDAMADDGPHSPEGVPEDPAHELWRNCRGSPGICDHWMKLITHLEAGEPVQPGTTYPKSERLGSCERRISSGTRSNTSCIMRAKAAADANRTSRCGLGRSKSMSAMSEWRRNDTAVESPVF